MFQAAGPYPVGHSTFLVVDSAHTRSLPTEVWYPAAESARGAAEAGEPIEEFVLGSADRAAFAALLPSAADPGTRRRTSSARDVALVGSTSMFPVVVFSHCFDCVRFSSFSIAERLASFGFVVVAPDHVTDTLFDALAGNAVSITAAFLEVRRQDVSAVLDAVLDPVGTSLPVSLRGRLDPARVGIFGHSFGAATVGLALKEDPRLSAGFALAAPLANPLFPAVTMADIHSPVFLLQANEDNSIGTAGNAFLQKNYDDATGPAWIAELADAGHWSVSDLCGLTAMFPAGCTTPATRQTDHTPFTYLDIVEARAIASSYVTAFFALELQNDPRAEPFLAGGHPSNLVRLRSKN